MLGSLLPDLLKNVDKSYSFKIDRYKHTILPIPGAAYISDGWRRHEEVDRLFHSSDYFITHTHALRKEIEDIVMDLPVRASFLAHISLELLLDHLLITQEELSVDRLYEHLNKVDRNMLNSYLQNFQLINIERFNTFYDKFVASRYIKDYEKVSNLPYALFNICKRVWHFTPSANHLEALAERLDTYQRVNMKDNRTIYNEIENCLNME